MNKLLYRIKHSLRKKDNTISGDVAGQSHVNPCGSVLRSRAIEVYGEDVYEQRRLYEKWVSRDSWKLDSEAIPLVFGFDPENCDFNDEEYRQLSGELARHARHCIEHNLSLSALNPAAPAENWDVRPTEFYRWASVSRVQMPDALVQLMEFVISTVMGEKDRVDQQVSHSDTATGTDSLAFDRHREQVLGAALAVMAEFPDRCRNRKGRLSVPAIVELIREHRAAWFSDDDEIMSSAAMQDLVNKWIKTLRPVIHG